MTAVKTVSDVISIPVWHKNFMSELIDLSHGCITDTVWEIIWVSNKVIRVDFKYIGHSYMRRYISLMFNDQTNIATLVINGSMQYYEYADPDFTPNKVLKDIRGKHDHARNRRQTPSSK